MPNQDTITYYARRAPHYDELYTKPERQRDLAELRIYLQATFAGQNVLEIACGTGFWTQAIAETAASVLATDINEPMLEIALQKVYPRHNVVFEARDMYHVAADGGFDALFGGFIWSHIPLEQLEHWLDHLHSLLKPGCRVVFTDNNFVPGSNTPVAGSDKEGNIFQQRKLPDGAEYLIVKNFPKTPDFDQLLQHRGRNIRVENLEYYWLLSYEVA